MQNHGLIYIISIEETYEIQCTIGITIKPCYSSCKKCSKENDLSSLEEHNCLECKENYYPLVTKLTNCYTESEKEPNWYLDTTRELYLLCDSTCKTCSGQNNNDCLSCYYSIDNPKYLYNGECLSECPLGTFINLIFEEHYICEDCYENCKSCLEKGDADNMLCQTCEINDITYNQNCYKVYDDSVKSFYKPETTDITSCLELHNLYIKEDTYECINFPNNRYYILNPITGLISLCHSDCETCSQGFTETSSNCDTCVNEYFFIQEGNCIEECSEGFYLVEEDKKCYKCHDNCLTCDRGKIEESGNLVSMECSQCKDNMIQNEKNCFPIIRYTHDEIVFDISEINPLEHQVSCSYFNKRIIYGEYQCIPKPNITTIPITELVRGKTTNNLINTEESKQEISNKNNEETKPQTTTNKIIIENNEELLQQVSNKSLIEMIDILDEIMSEVKIGTIYEVKNGNQKIKISPMNQKDIIKSDNTNNNDTISYSSSTFINFGNCEAILKRENHLSNDTILTVVQIELDNENEKALTNQVEYSVYDNEGNKLNLSVCNEEPIEINYVVSNPELLDTETISYYQNLGIDIFNISDKFFNDICVPYSINGSDVVLKDRISDIYQNFSICEDNCEFNGINLTTMIVSCNCNIKNDIDLEKKDLKFNSIYSDLFTETSFGVIKCYKLVFSSKNKSNNIGFIIFSVLILIHIPIIIYQLIKGIFPINSYMMKEMEKFQYIPHFYSPKKKHGRNEAVKFEEENNKNIKENNLKISSIQNSSNDLIEKKKRHKKRRNKNKSKENKRKEEITIFKSKDNNKLMISDGDNNDNKIDEKKILSKEKPKLEKNNNKEYINDIPSIESENKYNYFLIRIDANNKVNFTSYESNYYLDNYDYEEAILYDKRSFWRIYLICLLSKDNILNTFVLNTPLELKSIKICTFIFMYSCDLALNTLFYFSDNISDKYNYKGNNAIWFNILNNLTISLASSIMSFIIIFFMQFLTNSKDSYEEIFRAQEDKMKEDKIIK